MSIPNSKDILSVVVLERILEEAIARYVAVGLEQEVIRIPANCRGRDAGEKRKEEKDSNIEGKKKDDRRELV